MTLILLVVLSRIVALRKESVDRNTLLDFTLLETLMSLSARRAWIEIVIRTPIGCVYMVALRKESVDRNFSCWLLA